MRYLEMWILLLMYLTINFLSDEDKIVNQEVILKQTKYEKYETIALKTEGLK